MYRDYTYKQSNINQLGYIFIALVSGQAHTCTIPHTVTYYAHCTATLVHVPTLNCLLGSDMNLRYCSTVTSLSIYTKITLILYPMTHTAKMPTGTMSKESIYIIKLLILIPSLRRLYLHVNFTKSELA